MKKTLGIDLGSNSLGWAILDDVTGDILDKGVVVFPEGVDLDAGTSLETPAAVRRAARMGRRLRFRRKLRKWQLLKILSANGMCPISQKEIDDWRRHGLYPLGNVEFISWLKATDVSNPYCDRAAAADGKVAPMILGRALYHICQRRGFKSSRKEEAGMIDEETGELKVDNKNLGAVKSGIAELTAEIERTGSKTLGQYFFKRLESERGNLVKSRIRCHYTGRKEHYAKEFAAIMAAQGIKEGSNLYVQLQDAIFMQRPLRSQKHLVGKCPLEPKSPRAQIGHPAFEEFRMLSFVNNLSLEDEDGDWRDENGNFLYPLTPADRELIASSFYRASSNMKFGVISKLFKKDERFKVRKLRFHYYDDGDTVSTCRTRYCLQKYFGDVAFDEQMVFDAVTFFDDTEKLQGWFKKHYPALDAAAIAKLSMFHPKEGNANYSLKAIKKMLPFLRKGWQLSEARLFAKLPDVLENFEANETAVLEGLAEALFVYRMERQRYAELAPSIRKLTQKPLTLFDRYRGCLEKWGLSEDGWNRLYLRGDDVYEKETEYKCNGQLVKLARPRLPPVRLGMIRNPLVQRSMTTLRRLVNYLGDHGKLDPSDTIRIELARTVNDFASRKALQNWQKNRAKIRDEAVLEIQKLGIAATEDAIERYLLWEEQGRRCLYTGKSIKLSELLGGNKFDIEHTVPRSLSGDDSLANKTICEAEYNRQVKKGMVPRDCPNWDEIDVNLHSWRERLDRLEKDYRNQVRSARGKTDPVMRSKARVKAQETRIELNYWRDKIRRFDIAIDKLTVRDGELGGFKKRQLVDTGIMCSHAVALLKSVYPDTFAVNGAATAFARKAWGVQSDDAKDRTNHTHHAKDAMVIAALTPSRFNAICAALKDDGAVIKGRECDICPKPYMDFAERVRKACDEILVKHVLRQTTLKQSSKRNCLAKSHKQKDNPAKMVRAVLSKGDTVRGPLHKDTFYGCIVNPEDGSKAFVVRKSLVGPVDAALKFVDLIVDAKIREIVRSALDGMKADGVKSIDPGMIKMPSGVPINKVRIVAHTTNPSILRNHTMVSEKDYKTPYYVTSAEGSNFRLALYCNKGRYFVEPDNSLDWAKGHKRSDYVQLDQKDGFIGYIMPGLLALAYEKTPEELRSLDARVLADRLYKVVKFRSDDGRITFRFHREARQSTLLEKALKESGKSAKGTSLINFNEPELLLLMGVVAYTRHMLFEGIHFKMMLDGSIKFLI